MQMQSKKPKASAKLPKRTPSPSKAGKPRLLSPARSSSKRRRAGPGQQSRARKRALADELAQQDADEQAAIAEAAAHDRAAAELGRVAAAAASDA